MNQKPKGRPNGKPGARTAARTARRQTLAAAVITGKPITEIATAAGVSRSWASREANTPATRVLIDRLLDAHAETIAKLVGNSLKVLASGMVARDGRRKDHRVRLLAVKRLIELANAGRKHQDGEGGPVTVTWQQFLTVYEAQRASS